MLNKTEYIGRICNDIELRKSKKDDFFATFTLAVQRDNSEKVDYPDCICFKKTAENLYKYVKKGDLISVVGQTQTRIYNKRKITELKVDIVYYLNNKKTSENYSDNIPIPE